MHYTWWAFPQSLHGKNVGCCFIPSLRFWQTEIEECVYTEFKTAGLINLVLEMVPRGQLLISMQLQPPWSLGTLLAQCSTENKQTWHWKNFRDGDVCLTETEWFVALLAPSVVTQVTHIWDMLRVSQDGERNYSDGKSSLSGDIRNHSRKNLELPAHRNLRSQVNWNIKIGIEDLWLERSLRVAE